MKPTKGMLLEELKAEIVQMKIKAFDMYRDIARMPDPSITGHKTAAQVIDFAIKRIEARIQDWERNNP